MGLIEQAAKRLEEMRRTRSDAPEAIEPPPRETPRPVPAAVASPGLRAAEGNPGVPPLHIDLQALAAQGFVSQGDPRSRIAEEFRIVKRPLLANASSGAIKHGNLIMVTSSLPGEGKTFTAVNLALSIAAELDRTVLLVDGDVVRPSLPRVLGVAPTPELLDIVGHRTTSLAKATLRTNVPGLTFLASGRPSPTSAEVLASAAMGALLQQLSTERPERIVIFDAPPLLSTTEAPVLAERMGQVVLVVHAGSTPQADVRRAAACLEGCAVKLCILNGARDSAQGGYGYGYGHGDSARPPA